MDTTMSLKCNASHTKRALLNLLLSCQLVFTYSLYCDTDKDISNMSPFEQTLVYYLQHV